MGEEESITVANVSEGEQAGAPVDLPVVELLTGRAFLTGKSGSGKSNTASVVIERLLDRGFGVLIVDIEGEYYGLKEEYEILHAGADDECDIQVSDEHAGKLASLALEQNVPIILDLSGFLDESEGRELLKAVARQLFAKEKKCKQPFLMLVEEIHEYIPEGGGMDECGRMLVKVAKRGRKHGLGVAGISQRPADVKKDFITQCDWLVWHRLTWRNDTQVVKKVLGAEYAAEIEDMNDGEGFLMTDWGEQIKRVQFHRKETFDAGATPGLDDFERPDLKSVSSDLVSELQTISEEEAAREDEIGRLKRELEEREQRIAELKEELSEARDLSDMAQQFARAMTAQAEPRYSPTEQRELKEYADERDHEDEAPVETDEEDDLVDATSRLDDALTPEQRAIIQDAVAANEAGPDEVTVEQVGDHAEQPDDADGSSGTADAATSAGTAEATATNGTEDAATNDAADAAPSVATDAATSDGTVDAATNGTVDAAMNGTADTAATNGTADAVTQGSAPSGESTGTTATATSSSTNARAGPDADDVATDAIESNGDMGSEQADPRIAPRPRQVTMELRERVADLDPLARKMLASYRDTGVAAPEAVHEAAGGSGERPEAYSHNRELRRRGFVVHVGGGRYAYSVPSLVAANTDVDLDDDQRRQLVGEVEAALSW